VELEHVSVPTECETHGLTVYSYILPGICLRYKVRFSML
jgi:hypothetical protein